MKRTEQGNNFNDDANYGAAEHAAESDYKCARLAQALRELKDLLDQYAPAWYTQAHFEKASLALELTATSVTVPSQPEQQFSDSVVHS